MSDYDYDYDVDPEDELDERLAEEPVKPPENMKLTVEVGLSEYSPNGLLELIARGLLQQLGGKDRWQQLLHKMLLKIGEERARKLVEDGIASAWAGAEIDFGEIVRKASAEYMNEPVDSNGKAYADRHYHDKSPKRIEWLVAKLTREAMDTAFKAAEAEWKASTQQAIKETLADLLSARLAKALPSPAELK